MQKLTTKPLKGFRDFTPEDWAIQQHIFNIWKKVCEGYGYQEYNGPVLESADIYNKSGDDVGTLGKELYTFKDRGDRQIALRPEMTPTVGRMIAEYGKRYSKPIRWYSIAQFFRAENPQRGRGREFFQLNFDMFGSDSKFADLEIIQMAIDIMLAYGADENMFTLYINDRRFMNSFLNSILGDENKIVPVIRIMDKRGKVPDEVMVEMLTEAGLDKTQVNKLEQYMNLKAADLGKYSNLEGGSELIELLQLLKTTKYGKYCEFNPSLARGFDYYTGMVFEVFDKNPQNNRSMFGGGRYDKLVDLFATESVTAVGCAPGDVTARLFMESWNLLPTNLISKKESYYLPILDAKSFDKLIAIAESLREEGKSVIMGVAEESVSKALSSANKFKAGCVVLIGEQELINNQYKLKNMNSGDEQLISL